MITATIQYVETKDNPVGRRCEACGATEDLTRDHVVAKFILKTELTRAQYREFCRLAGKRLNIQKLCSTCNQEKGYQVIDFRGKETALMLQAMLKHMFDVDIDIEVYNERES